MSQLKAYLDNISDSQRVHFERVRKIVHQLVPGEVEETISYGIPTFKYKGKYVIYFAAFKNHMSVYPVSRALEKEMAEAIAEFRTSKGTLQFTDDHPIPDSIIKKMVQLRLTDLESK